MTQYEQMEKILENEDVRAQISTLTDPDEAYRILTENGLDVPREAFEELLMSIGEAVNEKLGEDELSEDDLENVAGGAGIALAIGGVSIKMTAAAAAAFGTGFAVGVGIGVAVGLGYLGYRLYKKYKK